MGCEKQRDATAPTYSARGKTAALVPEFAEDLPSAELQPRFLHLQLRSEHFDDDYK